MHIISIMRRAIIDRKVTIYHINRKTCRKKATINRVLAHDYRFDKSRLIANFYRFRGHGIIIITYIYKKNQCMTLEANNIRVIINGEARDG